MRRTLFATPLATGRLAQFLAEPDSTHDSVLKRLDDLSVGTTPQKELKLDEEQQI
ncbi:MAG TPA: hypothetical protein VMT24_04360 [Aggregatilineaceae bacterium]|nr:hypothetical protein [Aggregatilineaceae bacterium]